MKAYKVWYGESAKNCIFSIAKTFEQAVEAIANNKETIKTIKSATVGITMVECGTCRCGRIETKEVLDDIGECLLCEKIRGDAEQDKYEEEVEEDEDNDCE